MHYSTRDWYTIIKRHYILLFFRLAKFGFLLLLVGLLYWFSLWFLSNYEDLPFMRYLFFTFLFLLLNYAFFSLILSLIRYYFNLIVIYKDQIVFIHCTLLFRDDIEVFDSYRIMKVDGYARWFFANVLWFWTLVIEQQKNDVRLFHFIPKPYRILLIIKKQRESVLAERQKKYIVPTEEEAYDAL